MHPLDVVESDRWSEALPGLVPEATLRQHARMALDMLRGWLLDVKAGRRLRTRTGSTRVLPKTMLWLARQYVNDHFQPLREWSPRERQYAYRYYSYALEVALLERLEIIAFLLSHSNTRVRNTARRWMPVARHLGLEDA